MIDDPHSGSLVYKPEDIPDKPIITDASLSISQGEAIEPTAKRVFSLEDIDSHRFSGSLDVSEDIESASSFSNMMAKLVMSNIATENLKLGVSIAEELNSRIENMADRCIECGDPIKSLPVQGDKGEPYCSLKCLNEVYS